MTILLLLMLFQVNQQHPPVDAHLTPTELNSLALLSLPVSTPGNAAKVKAALIESHYPAGEPKAACPSTEGYIGRLYRNRLIYTWEAPKC